jgi:hypothetical protein
MKLKNSRRLLCKIFEYESWDGPGGLKENLKEAKHPYPITVDWQAMALGRRKDGKLCVFGDKLGRMGDVDEQFVGDHYTWIRFVGSPTIWKFGNSTEMKHQIAFFDEHGMYDDMEDGDVFVLEPIGKARSKEYQEERRRKIESGEWEVKVRGPNPNPRKQPIHHFRPY